MAATTEPVSEADSAETARRHARGQCWAALMQRSFGFDVLTCPRCGGRLRLIALIEEAAVIGRILRHLGMPTEIPPLDHARGALSDSRRAAPRAARAPPFASDERPQVEWDDDPAACTAWS
jgi:hypothetical protein